MKKLVLIILTVALLFASSCGMLGTNIKNKESLLDKLGGSKEKEQAVREENTPKLKPVADDEGEEPADNSAQILAPFDPLQFSLGNINTPDDIPSGYTQGNFGSSGDIRYDFLGYESEVDGLFEGMEGMGSSAVYFTPDGKAELSSVAGYTTDAQIAQNVFQTLNQAAEKLYGPPLNSTDLLSEYSDAIYSFSSKDENPIFYANGDQTVAISKYDVLDNKGTQYYRINSYNVKLPVLNEYVQSRLAIPYDTQFDITPGSSYDNVFNPNISALGSAYNAKVTNEDMGDVYTAPVNVMGMEGQLNVGVAESIFFIAYDVLVPRSSVKWKGKSFLDCSKALLDFAISAMDSRGILMKTYLNGTEELFPFAKVEDAIAAEAPNQVFEYKWFEETGELILAVETPTDARQNYSVALYYVSYL